MFFDTSDFVAEKIEVFHLKRAPYRKASDVRPFHAISFRVYGNAKYETTDKTICAEKGDLLFVPAYVTYTKDTQAESFYVVHFTAKEHIGDKLRHLSPKNPKLFLELFEHLYQVQTEKEPGHEYQVRQLFYRLVFLIERELFLSKKDPMDDAINRSVQIIHENISRPDFTIADLGKRLNMSETYFRRQFQKYKGVSPKKYVSDLRLQMALKLLRSGYYSVSEVADQCGFASAYYFSAFLKKMIGKSPREIRRDEHNDF